ncbi:hypothetical protein BJ138DRAFT_1120785, partial [Hygrophoropsis aurantiaca]
MPQPVPTRMTTRSKNANQHPGLIDINPPNLGISEPATRLRRNKAQKLLDDERKAIEDKQAAVDAAEALIAIKQGYSRVAALEEKMKVSQDNQKADAPKPCRPRPRPKNRALPVSDNDDEPQEGLAATEAVDSEVDRATVSEAEEEPVKPANGKLKGKGKKERGPPKPLKTAVRDAISAIKAAHCSKTVDKISHAPRDKSTEADLAAPPVSKKNEISGRVQNWTAGVDPDQVSQPKRVKSSGFQSSTVHSTLVGSSTKTSRSGSSTIAKSTLSSGTSARSKIGPIRLPTLASIPKISSALETTPDPSPIVGNWSVFDTNDDDEDDAMAEELERQAALIRAKKQQRKMGLVHIKVERSDISVNERSEKCKNDETHSQSAADENNDSDTDNLETQNVTSAGHAEDEDVVMLSADEDFELTPPPSTQPPRAADLKRKRISDPVDSSDSEIEIIDAPPKLP